jgi:precorrin-6B methylase 2
MQYDEVLTPESINNLAYSFQQSRVLLTAVELEIFTVLDKRMMHSSEIAKIINCDERALNRLMNALVALKFLKKIRGKFYNNEFSARYLVKDKPDYMGNLHHTNNLWNLWSTLTESVKQGKKVLKGIDSKEGWQENFIDAMHYRARKEAKIISLMLDLSNVTKMLDIGGGSGAFTYEFLLANEKMRGAIFDLPEIIPIAQKYSLQYNLIDRIDFIKGNYLTDSFGRGYDLILLSAIVHINSYEQNNKLIGECAESLSSGGQIIIRDFLMNDDRTDPPGGALFSLNMLVGTECGDTFTENEMMEWFKNSGIEKVIRKETSFGSNLLIGIKN